MARKKKKSGENLSEYFRVLFAEHPEWLHGSSNKVVIDQYNTDHPDQPAGSRIKSNLANIKSNLRSKTKATGKPARSRGRPKKVEIMSSMPAVLAVPESTTSPLDALEFAIDDCLITARTMGRRDLDKVIDHLRHARNLVVWKAGQ